MTREEAIADIRDNMKPVVGGKSLDMAIEALEHELELRQALEMEKGAYNALVKDLQCSDCISRQAVLEAIEDDNRNAHYSCFASNNDAECFKQIIRELPPVTPAEKQEPRENVSDINDGNIYECPCGYGWDKNKVVRHHFCPNCGRKVQEVEE